MARRQHSARRKTADSVAFSVFKQMVKLAAITFELRAGIEHFAKHTLHPRNLFRNTYLAACCLL